MVLDYFREQFIKEMDANTVVMEFEYKGIISVGIRDTILRTDCPKLQNECLHAYLMKACTDDALKTACDVITGVRGNTRMQALGKEMKSKVESGVCCFTSCMFTVRSLYTGVISGSVQFIVIVVSSLHSAGHSGGLASLRSGDLQKVRRFVRVYTCVWEFIVCILCVYFYFYGCVYLLGSVCKLTDSYCVGVYCMRVSIHRLHAL